jgi:hypothetical protein
LPQKKEVVFMYGTYAVKYEGKEVGTLKVYSEGLMTVFAAETLPLSGVWRIAVVSKGKTIPIGVLAPSQRGLYLKKNFTKNMLAELNVSGIEAVVLLSQEHSAESGWKPVYEPSGLFSDSDLKAACKGSKGVMALKEGEVTKAAFPIRSDAPFALMPAFCLGKPLKIGGNDYLVFTVKDGEIFA